MSERHWRCRYFPRCMIHTGDPMPRRFSNENREEMRRMYFHDRLGLTEIGQTFTCSPDTVAKIVDLWRKP